MATALVGTSMYLINHDQGISDDLIAERQHEISGVTSLNTSELSPLAKAEVDAQVAAQTAPMKAEIKQINADRPPDANYAVAGGTLLGPLLLGTIGITVLKARLNIRKQHRLSPAATTQQ